MKQVFKAQTYHVGNGDRACKTHEGVVDKKDQLLQQEKQAKIDAETRKEEERKRREKENHALSQQITLGIPFCWFCNESGISSQEFYYRILMHDKVQELKGQMINPFDPKYAEQLRAVFGLKPGETQRVISIIATQDPKVINSIPNRDARTAASIGGAISICQECIEKHKIERPVPKMNLEQMVTLGIIMEPALKAHAQKILDEEARKS